MKTLVATLCMVISCSAFAKTNFAKPVALDKVEVDGAPANLQGSVSIVKQQEGKFITVMLSAVCKETQPCPKFIRIISAQLKQVSKNSCGGIEYSAVTDARPVDGNRTEIRLMDNTDDSCRHFVYPVEVQASVQSLRSEKAVHYLMAKTRHDPNPTNGYIDFSQEQVLNSIVLNGKLVEGAKGSVQIVNADVTIKYEDEQKRPAVLTATLEKKGVDTCGSVIYSVDNGKKLGYGINIEIKDNSHFTCESMVAVRPIEIHGTSQVVYPNAPVTTYDFAQ